MQPMMLGWSGKKKGGAKINVILFNFSHGEKLNEKQKTEQWNRIYQKPAFVSILWVNNDDLKSIIFLPLLQILKTILIHPQTPTLVVSYNV